MTSALPKLSPDKSPTLKFNVVNQLLDMEALSHDRINITSKMHCVQALERIAGLLEGSAGSIVLSERGDSTAVQRHPDFRLLAAMNPATDAGLQCYFYRVTFLLVAISCTV